MTHVATAVAEPTRRDFLFIATGAVGAVGAAAMLWPFVSQMAPDAATIAAGAPVDFDLAPVAALAATYLAPLGSSDLVDGGPRLVAWSGEALKNGRLEFAPDGQGTVSLAEAGRCASRVKALAAVDPGARTHRLLYRWHWSPPAS